MDKKRVKVVMKVLDNVANKYPETAEYIEDNFCLRKQKNEIF